MKISKKVLQWNDIFEIINNNPLTMIKLFKNLSLFMNVYTYSRSRNEKFIFNTKNIEYKIDQIREFETEYDFFITIFNPCWPHSYSSFIFDKNKKRISTAFTKIKFRTFIKNYTNFNYFPKDMQQEIFFKLLFCLI